MNLTKKVREANLKRWKAQGPAVIDSPLKALYEKYLDMKGHNDLVMRIACAEARCAAQRGDGVAVKAAARVLA